MANTDAYTNDLRWMARAIQLAEKGRYTTMPNPAVGCVMVKNGQLVAEGWHERAGLPHAEINALQLAGKEAKGATAYVSLEPCSHHGKTPPCVDALIAAGVARVVFGMMDPNPQVSGRGINTLRDAGVEVVGPVLEAQAQQLNPGFIKRQTLSLPWVRLKIAASLDGRTAMASGESQWITGAAARRDVQRLRANSCAIVTGIGTVLADNPSLTVRSAELGVDPVLAEKITQRQPLRVVLDTQRKMPTTAKVVTDGGRTLWISASGVADLEPMPAEAGNPAEQINLEGVSAGQAVEQLTVAHSPDAEGLDLLAVLKVLAQKECNTVLVEAGATLAGAFLQAGLVDELVIYQAPTLLGSKAKPMLDLPLVQMAEQHRLEIIDRRTVGDDLKITARCS